MSGALPPVDSNPGASAGRGVASKKPTLVNGKITYSFNEAVSLALKDQISAVVKAVRYTAIFAGKAMETAPPSLGEFCKQLGNFKNILSVRNLHKGIPNVCSSFYNAVTERSASAACNALQDCGACFGAIADTAEVTATYFPSVIPLAVGSAVKNANVFFLGACSTVSVISAARAYGAADKEGQGTLSLLRLATNVSYLALAAISIGCMAMGVAPSALTVVTCLASGTAFGLLGFFYEMCNDPYGANYANHQKLGERVKLAS